MGYQRFGVVCWHYFDFTYDGFCDAINEFDFIFSSMLNDLLAHWWSGPVDIRRDQYEIVQSPCFFFSVLRTDFHHRFALNNNTRWRRDIFISIGTFEPASLIPEKVTHIFAGFWSREYYARAHGIPQILS